MLQFKTLVHKKTEVPPNQQRLIYAGKQFEDDQTLADYGVQPKHTVYLVLCLPDGSHGSRSRPFPAGVPCFNEPCSICYDSPSLKMPCGHFYCPSCIVQHSWNEVKSGGSKTEIKCFKDNKEWSLSIIQRYGSISDSEIDALAKKLSENFIKKNSNIVIRDCPGCQCYCEQMDKNKNKVYCRQCAKEKKVAEYCFHCSRPWMNPNSTTDCGNSNCGTGNILYLIHTAPYKEVIGVRCPSIRLCPKCGCKIEHERDCKHMKCPTCFTEFCFICLRTKQGGQWQCGKYRDKCAVAQIQTVIPKLK